MSAAGSQERKRGTGLWCVAAAALDERTTLILAAVSSRSSLSRLVSAICSSTVAVWYSCSSLHSGGGILSSSIIWRLLLVDPTKS